LVTVIKALFLVGATPKMGFYFFITKKLSGRVGKVYAKLLILDSKNINFSLFIFFDIL